MKNNIVTFTGVSVLVLMLVVLGLVIVNPVLAQVEATSESVSTTTEVAIEVAPIGEASAPTTETPVQSAPSDPEASDEVTSEDFPGAETSSETPPEGLTEVQIIGTEYIDYFTDGASEYSFPGDPEIHAHIAEKDGAIPTHEGLTWVHSVGRPLYDTPSGDLEEGQYAVQPNGSIIAKQPPFVSFTSTPAVLGTSTTAESTASTGDAGASSSPTGDALSSSTSPDVDPSTQSAENN